MPRSRNADLYGNSMFNIWRTTRLFFKVVASFYIPNSIIGSFQFLHLLVNIYYVFFYYSHPSWYEVVPHLVLIWFSLWLIMFNIFSCAQWPCSYLLWKNVYSNISPIFKMSHLSLLLSCMNFLKYILDIGPLLNMHIYKYFPHFEYSLNLLDKFPLMH